MLLSLDCARLKAFIDPLLDLPDHSIRDRLAAFAKANGIRLV
jgi:hypothetical protein